MPLNSVCQHVKGLLDGLAIPDQTLPLDAMIQPPPIDIPTGPKAYVWASNGAWKRQTMPRGQGFQQFDWPLDIWLTLLTSTQVPDLDQLHLLFVDAVLMALLTAPMPIFITDPTTGLETQLWQIAEAGKIANPPGRTTENVRLLLYGTALTVTVREVVQA